MQTINIKGKEYTPVAERLKYFAENYPNGSVVSELLTPYDAPEVWVKATVTPDVANPARCFIGHSQASWDDSMINKSAALENCETSAWGRAFSAMGVGITDSVASADEMHKATSGVTRKPAPYSTGETAKPCSDCSTACTVAETGYSTKTYGRPLCRNCQAAAKGHVLPPQ